MESIGERLRAARGAAGMKQVEAAAFAGISGAHLSKIENGRDRASLEVLLRLAIAYRVPLNELAKGDHEFASIELASSPEEIAWLRAFRRMAPEQQTGALALLGLSKRE